MVLFPLFHGLFTAYRGDPITTWDDPPSRDRRIDLEHDRLGVKIGNPMESLYYFNGFSSFRTPYTPKKRTAGGPQNDGPWKR